MNTLDSLFDKAMKTGKKIEMKKTAKENEMSQAEEAVKVAAEEMEKAAIEGNETEYAQAKETRNAAENRLEILRIRKRNHIETDWISECSPILNELEKEGTNEIRKMIREFLTKYDELCCMVDEIEKYSSQYNKVQEYYKSYVLKSPEYIIKYMAEILPIAQIIDFKRKYSYQRSVIEKAASK